METRYAHSRACCPCAAKGHPHTPASWHARVPGPKPQRAEILLSPKPVRICSGKKLTSRCSSRGRTMKSSTTPMTGITKLNGSSAQSPRTRTAGNSHTGRCGCRSANHRTLKSRAQRRQSRSNRIISELPVQIPSGNCEGFCGCNPALAQAKLRFTKKLGNCRAQFRLRHGTHVIAGNDRILSMRQGSREILSRTSVAVITAHQHQCRCLDPLQIFARRVDKRVQNVKKRDRVAANSLKESL